MSKLKQQVCEPCRAGATVASAAEMAQWHRELPDWQIVERNGEQQLFRQVTTGNFLESMALAEQISTIADSSGHHPELVVGWGYLGVYWWTHKLRGLHRNDFIMAALTDELFTP